jgi:hypothetical protein
MDAAQRPPVDVAIIASRDDAEAQAMLNVLNGYAPESLVALGESSSLPLLTGRTRVEGRATAYVCQGQHCLPPVTAADDLARALGRRPVEE